MRRSGTAAKSLGALAFWLGVWAVLSVLIGRPLLLPAPWTVAERLLRLAGTAAFWHITAVSLGRILLGAALGVLAGVVTAVATNRYRFLNAVLSPLLSVIRATPVASFILLALIWIGRSILPSVIVFLMVLPLVWSNVSAGMAATDGQLLEMARVYRLSRWQIARRVYGPSVGPYLLSACHTSLGLAWKSGVAAEVLTMPAFSIGRQLYESKLYMEMTDLFAWTAMVVMCSIALEKLFTALIRRLGRRRSMGGQGQ